MKNTKTVLWTLFIVSALAFTTKTDFNKTSQIVITSNDIATIQNQIDLNFQRGYKVVFMTAQSISTTVGGRHIEKTVKGDVIVVMEK